MYSLTLDEVQNQLGDLGKPLTSMNLDELLKNVWTPSLSLTGALSKKTVDEVWRDIQGHGKNSEEKKSRERQPTLGEMTLEDFLVKAGVVAEPSDKKIAGTPLPMGPSSVMDVTYPDNQVALSSPLMGALSDTQAPGRKRVSQEDMIEKTVERRQKRMIKNRESAARSRARKQAYTNELENKVSRLEEENERLRKRKELEKMLPSAPPPEPKYQLRRTSSAPF
ncbi:unnamed protein product, partial [Vitis vinifera]